MCDQWMPTLRWAMTAETFARLPRHPAYRYEFQAGEVRVTPQPRFLHGVLTLQPREQAQARPCRPVRREDQPRLESLFAQSFAGVQPFGSCSSEELTWAAGACLQRFFTGGDGPWLEQASWLALDSSTHQPLGAALVSLLPLGDPTDQRNYYWDDPVPEHAIALHLGRPHLTWLFVTPRAQGRGLARLLLERVEAALLSLGFRELTSTFLVGNEASLLWHWRRGFRLVTTTTTVLDSQVRNSVLYQPET